MPDKVWSDYTIEELQQAALDGTLTSIPYEPQEPWCDGLENYTPLTEERMNRMELGIQRANDAWDSKSQKVDIRLRPGWTLRQGGSFNRIGNMIVFSATFHKSAFADGEAVFALPVNYLPDSTEKIGFPALVVDKGTNARLLIDPITGQCTIHSKASVKTTFDVAGSWRIRNI